MNTGYYQPSGRNSETENWYFVESHNIREKINYVLYSKQENQGEGEGVDLDEKDSDIQRKMSIE